MYENGSPNHDGVATGASCAPLPAAAVSLDLLEKQGQPETGESRGGCGGSRGGGGGSPGESVGWGGAFWLGAHEYEVCVREESVEDQVQGRAGTRTIQHKFLCARAWVRSYGGGEAARTGAGAAAEGAAQPQSKTGAATPQVVLAFPLEGRRGTPDCQGGGGDGIQEGGGGGGGESAAGDGGACFVYAFLPVYSAGLSFAVHADFDLVTSRQSLRSLRA